ncbi:desmethyl-deoxy-podophyllotoxin synthase-like [Hevea brasiliensis]|nr:desmethyl-deoxy-podophyllotoxin synthase-like [Hevea brasiliensis]
MRKICTLELLSAKRVLSFRSIREEEVSDLMRSISSNSGSLMNLSKMLAAFSFGVISRAAFGRTRNVQESFVPLIEEIILLSEGFSISDLFPSVKMLRMISGMRSRLERLHQEADRILENIINDHKARKAETKLADEANDLVDVLLKLQDQENREFPLTIDNIKAVILDMFIAGSDTSFTTSEWAISEMLKNPRVMKKAQAEVRQVFSEKGHVDEADLGELNYLKLVIKETLRLHPPVPLLIPRESREQCEINGYQIPIKSKLIVNAWAIGRDPNYWTEADRFNPERFSDSTVDYKGANMEFIPFGAGRRMCPGISFGIANVEILLANLLFYFDWKLPHGMKQEELDMAESFGAVARRKNDLGLIPTLSHPLPVA